MRRRVCYTGNSMSAWRWVKARVAWSCRACGARNDLRADDGVPTCRACSVAADGGRSVPDLLSSVFDAGGTPPSGELDVELRPLLPFCGTCTALVDTRWTDSGDCVLRCAPCGREHVFPRCVGKQHDNLRTIGANPRDPVEVWAYAKIDGALASALDEESREPPANWPLIWLGSIILFSLVSLLVARLLW